MISYYFYDSLLPESNIVATIYLLSLAEGWIELVIQYLI